MGEPARKMKKEVVLFDIKELTEENIAEMKTQADEMSIDEKGKGYQEIVKAHKQVKSLRIKVDKRLVELKEPNIAERKRLLDENHKFEKEAGRLIGLLSPIEKIVKSKRIGWENKLKADKEEKARLEQERVEGIRSRITGIGKVLNTTMGKNADEINAILQDLKKYEITDELYHEFKGEAQAVYDETIRDIEQALKNRTDFEIEREKQRLEDERLAKVREEQEAKEKELEEKRKAQDEADLKAEKKRLAKEIELREEREAFEAEKKAEQERKEREEFERKVEEAAKAKAEKEAKEKAEREAREKEEAEKREAEAEAIRKRLQPDKDKIQEWLNDLDRFMFDTIPSTSIKDKGLREELDGMQGAILELISNLKDGIKGE